MKKNTHKTTSTIKTFVLDTNVLLHDPDSIFKFQDNNVVLPVEVLGELDSKKTAPGSLGKSARTVNRHLRKLFETRELDELQSVEESRRLSADLPDGGHLYVVINEHFLRNDPASENTLLRLRATLGNLNEPDHRILASALFVQTAFEQPVIMVTKDSNMAVKGMALGLLVQDYKNDQVEEDLAQDQLPIFPVSNACIEALIESAATDSDSEISTITLEDAEAVNLPVNAYALLEADGIHEPVRHLGEGEFACLPIYREYCSRESGTRSGLQMPKGNRAVPRNWEQWVFMDALLNPEIHLVTAKGKAGTGKTFVAIASALAQVLSEHSHFTRCYVSRPVVQIGKDIGALPGDKDEKLAPYIQPYFDNLEALFGKKKETESNSPQARKKGRKAPPKVFGNSQGQEGQAPRKPYQWLLDSGLIEIEALGFIRGRSIANAFMIVDEAQNLTPHEAKTIVTRMAEGSKLVLIGDPAQIDSPFLDSRSNGLVHVRQNMQNLKVAAHVVLTEGVRSPLSELAADLL